MGNRSRFGGFREPVLPSRQCGGLSLATGIEANSDQAKAFDLIADSVAQGESVQLRRDANSADVKNVDDDPQPNDLSLFQGATTWKRDPSGKPLSPGFAKLKPPYRIVSGDGVLVYLMRSMPLKEALENAKRRRGKLKQPLAIVAVGDVLDEAACEELLDAYAPRLLIVDAAIEKVGEHPVEHLAHNTVAFSTSSPRKIRVVSLQPKPYELSDAVSKLFTRKENAQRATREMFAALSVEQMNFKPSNGTHTPRWNAEHMMGRELLFFSQIYHALDPSIPVMNLNPEQMPKDYQFAHEDWSGEEEARQLKRVEDFTRRFAYLLDGIDIRKKAPGSRFWSVGALLLQMEKHYNAHSANVREKMKLDDWPQD